MKIVRAKPPMYDEIHAVFPMCSRPGVVFTWGDTIYVPHGGEVGPELRAHEGVHFSRQGNDTAAIEAWWRRYLQYPDFRLAEEIPAYRAQAQQFRANRPWDRKGHIHYAHRLADILAGGLYGKDLITPQEARRRILS